MIRICNQEQVSKEIFDSYQRVIYPKNENPKIFHSYWDMEDKGKIRKVNQILNKIIPKIKENIL